MVAVTFDTSDVLRVMRRLSKLINPAIPDLMERFGIIVESQVKQRIQDEKKSPDGDDWPDWSDAYAESKPQRGSLLQLENNLLESIQFLLSGKEVEIGSNLVYAAVHQFGFKGIKAREYLGLSPDNDEEIAETLNIWVDQQLEGFAV